MIWNLTAFLTTLVVFHTSEFFLAFLFMRRELNWQSWLFSKPYCIAMGLAFVEFTLELWFMPVLKTKTVIIAAFGLTLVVAGEAIRKAGMLTAKGAFTHLVKQQKRPEHSLITWGIYRHVRHPGYMGWYIWAVGTQVLLVNPFSAVLFTYVAWNFFNTRIQYEEYYLRRFFPEYGDYATRTPSGIPLIA